MEVIIRSSLVRPHSKRATRRARRSIDRSISRPELGDRYSRVVEPDIYASLAKSVVCCLFLPPARCESAANHGAAGEKCGASPTPRYDLLGAGVLLGADDGTRGPASAGNAGGE